MFDHRGRAVHCGSIVATYSSYSTDASNASWAPERRGHPATSKSLWCKHLVGTQCVNRCNFVRIHVFVWILFITSATDGSGEVEQFFSPAGNMKKTITSGEILPAEVALFHAVSAYGLDQAFLFADE